MKLRLFLSLLLFFPALCFAQPRATEIRAVWLTTNWGLDWPSQPKTSVANQKAELCKILDQLHDLKFNTVLFQARAQGEAFYSSNYQPLSKQFNSTNGFDPLAFAIDECHKRGMECHAWLITFPVEKQKMTGKGKKRKPVKEVKPDNYKAFEGTWYLDPGHPDTKKQLVQIAEEVVRNYDVDGIHFDYIRYPSNTRKFPDEDTYRKYGQNMNLFDWRRQNINDIVSAIYDRTKAIKKWVQVSSSPLGRYRILPEVNKNDGWTAYETVFQDAGKWMRDGKHDLLFPMMYYRKHNFEPFLDDWIKNDGGRYIVPGIGIYQMMKEEQDWDAKEISEQIIYSQKNGAKGLAFFRVGNITSNLKGIKDSLHVHYVTAAKLPPLTWLNDTIPHAPADLRVSKDNTGNLHIEWDAPDNNNDYTYNIYVSKTGDFDLENPYLLLETGLRGKAYSFVYHVGDFGYYYTVTASDRYHNESSICLPAYFVHSADEK